MVIITIRGQLGSGATDIGKRVAERLQIDYVDREVIAGVAKQLDYPEKKIESQEMPPTSVFKRIGEALGRSYPASISSGGISAPMPMYLPASEIPLDDDSYLKGLETTIQELAKENPIVISGRGSQFILKDNPDTFHVLITAPLAIRINRVMGSMNLNKNAARQEIKKYDSSRHEFIKRYFKADLEDPNNYDMVINTEHLSYEDAASIIIDSLALQGRVAGD
jgi:cytidylate kinase